MEGFIQIILSIVAFCGIAITGYYAYKSTKATAEIEPLKKKIADLETENTLLWKMIKDCQDNKVDK